MLLANNSTNLSFIQHEIGHNLNLAHSGEYITFTLLDLLEYNFAYIQVFFSLSHRMNRWYGWQNVY